MTNSTSPTTERDNEQGSDLEVGRIEEAARVIDPVFRNSPQYVDEQLCAALGRTVLVKSETANPLRSFKGRGADFMLRELAPGAQLICASSGNFGQAVAYAGRARGATVDVFVPTTINPGKRQRMESFGARLTLAGHDSVTARDAAAEFADAHPEAIFLRDGLQAAIAEGAGSIGVELTAEHEFDTIVLPIGDGALIAGVGRWIKAQRPGTRVIGVNAAGCPSMLRSLEAGHAVALDSADTFADGILVTTPFEESVRRVRAVVDEVVLVSDESILTAMELAARTLGVLLEPAGAAGLAAIQAGAVQGDRIATVLTGANPRPEQVSAVAARLHEAG